MLDLTQILACPHCGTAMTRQGASLVCGAGHSYDIARAGYVNLLPPGKGRNAGTGDGAEMVMARRDFLALGFYDPISDGIRDAILDHTDSDTVVIADAGCGEGHHTCRIAAGVRDGGRDVLCAAFDASKNAAAAGEKLAIRMGLAPSGGIGIAVDGAAGIIPADGDVNSPAGNDDNAAAGRTLVGFMTGNIFHLPLLRASCDAVLSMFAPIPWEECARVLKRGGIVVVAASGEEHLIEMRRVIYESVSIKSPSPECTDNFELIGHRKLKYGFSLERSDDIMNLYSMTPFKYRTAPESESRLSSLPRIDLTADVEYFIYRKTTE